MARPLTTSDGPHGPEERLLAGLLALYGEEQRIYTQILELSRRQGALFQQDGSFAEVRRILEAKKKYLDDIARLEQRENRIRAEWEAGKEEWSGAARARLHHTLQEVSALIEEILMSEDENDRLLLRKTGVA